MIIHYETLTISKTSIQTQTSSMDHFFLYNKSME